MPSGRQFEGATALVTGASSGIGEATALAFAREGASVVVADIKVDEGQAVVEAIRRTGADAHFIRCDVRSEDDIRHMVAETVSRFGRLDCAFNNAGVEGVLAPLAEQTNQAWDNVINTDLRGAWLCMKYEIEQMLAQGGGTIVNCSSICGVVGVKGMSSYVAAKHGLVGLTKAAALDYATQNIRINAVCPGAILTRAAEVGEFISDPVERDKMNQAFLASQPIGRWGTPDEVANAVLWLCGPGSSLMLGHAMVVDGAWTAH